MSGGWGDESDDNIIDPLLVRLYEERCKNLTLEKRAIVITGGREHKVTPEEMMTFFRLFTEHGGTELHHGDARGVDRSIAAEARARGITVIDHPVSKSEWEEHGKIAGFIRNTRMLSTPGVKLLIAFPGDNGTRNCVQRAKAMKIKVVYVVKEMNK